jgi:hypothetical protein
MLRQSQPYVHTAATQPTPHRHRCTYRILLPIHPLRLRSGQYVDGRGPAPRLGVATRDDDSLSRLLVGCGWLGLYTTDASSAAANIRRAEMSAGCIMTDDGSNEISLALRAFHNAFIVSLRAHDRAVLADT